MSDVRSEAGYSPSPKMGPSDATLKPVARISQLMTPPFSPAKDHATTLPRSGDDSLAYYVRSQVDGPLFPDEVSNASNSTSLVSAPQKALKLVEVVQGYGIKRKWVEVSDDDTTAKRSKTEAFSSPKAWFVAKYSKPQDTKRYLEREIARIGRMKVFRPRVAAPLPPPEVPARRSHKRGASSGNIKRGRPVTNRSPRTRAIVDFQTTTRANGTPIDIVDVRPPKAARPRAAPKVVDPNAPPKVSKGQRTDAEFEEALASTASQIFYPPNDNLDKLSPNAMKVEWKSSKKVYAQNESGRFDGLKNIKFHSKEIDLAGTINMVHFAQYEESKRLIFQFWYERKLKGQNFTKTHAQQAAHVDVNKASALWTAFDKVNWFTDEAFRLVSQKKKSWYA